MAALRIVIAALVAALFAASPPLITPPAPRPSTPNAVTVIRSRIMHVLASRPPAELPPPQRPPVQERKGPRCIAADAIAGAAVAGPDAVDISLRGGDRLRARLDAACPALDFYRGFYVKPGEDGRICADRDSIRTRSGGACGIDRFRRLLPPDRVLEP